MAAGCGKARETYPVSGSVAFDGQPVADGYISFAPADDRSHGPVAGKITAGQYRLEARAGRQRVEIRASRLVPGPGGAMGPRFEDYIPPQFNTASTLERDVAPTDENHFDFDLQSQPRS